jgi:hypothetical protein
MVAHQTAIIANAQKTLALALQEADPTGLNHRLVRVTETTAHHNSAAFL